MKFKSILLTAAATISLATATMAQVPTNGLVGWWPFNGNANDESGNGNNGTLIGSPALTSDRFGNPNKAYSFNNTHNYINCGNNSSLNFNGPFTMSAWVKTASNYNNCGILGRWNNSPGNYGHYLLYLNIGQVTGAIGLPNTYANASFNFFDNNWHFYTILFDGNNVKVFIDGGLASQQIFTGALNNVSQDFLIASYSLNAAQAFVGEMDDISVYNRSLTQQEITDLYNAVNCANNTTITPQTNSLVTGSTANFTATTSDPNPSYVWQSDFGQGYVTLNNYGNYSGVNTNSLSISNVQLPNHTQQIRVISTSDNCIDTSNVAVINILDTCLITVYDTLLTTVTDTLVINTQITGINPPNNLNTLKVFPNPASTHITIDYCNFIAMSGYSLKIVNAVGQTVFTTPINQQTSYIDLSTWTGTGIYFVQLIDPQNNTIENRKIVIQ